MPIYEYWCPNCKASFEQLRPMGSKDAEVTCQQCNSSVRKMFSLVATIGRSPEGERQMAGGGCGCGGGGCGCGRNNNF